MRKKNMAVFAVILAFVLVLFAAACNGQNGNEKQDEKVDYKARYLEFVQSASTDEIEPELAGFKLRDESKLDELRTSAAEKLHDAADDEAVRAVYKEFINDARTIIHKEYAMFAQQWQDRFEAVRESMTPAPGKEDLYRKAQFRPLLQRGAYGAAKSASLRLYGRLQNDAPGKYSCRGGTRTQRL